MRDKNLLLFLLLTTLVLGGWLYLRQMTHETDNAKKEREAQVAKNKEEKKEPPKAKEEPKEKPPEKKQEQPVAEEKQPKVEETIGGEGDYYIEAVLTSQGAGVRRLTLNRFEAADWLGLPTDKKLQLIQDDPYEPSFRMYHFPGGRGEVGVQPVLGLGETQWKLEQVKKAEEAHEVTFSAPLPGVAKVRIFKTYRLEPRTYHLSLTLRVEDRRAGGDPILFQYQMTGGHGLPVEGEWFTGTFRNAVIGQVDDGTLYRELETSDRISLRAGGDPVPLSGSLGKGVFIQYAGVLNQYFGSVIVADNEQPPSSEGGGDFKGLIAWARPTLESSEIKGFIIDRTDDELVFLEAGTKGPKVYRLLERVKHHLEAIDLDKNARAVLSFYETPGGTRVATWIRAGHTPRGNFDDITVRINSGEIKLTPGKTVAHRYLLYHGPAKTRLLDSLTAKQGPVDPALAQRYTDTLHLYSLTDYQTMEFSKKIGLTYVIITCTRAMHWILGVLAFLLAWVPSWLRSGLTIIMLTVIVRGLMFPISRRQAMFSIKMQALAPELKKISEKYKNDAAAKGQAVMELYRKHGVHPLGSCLPLLLQMPIFMGLYFALQESIQFRLAPFLWVRNLAAPDMLLYWSQSIPFISEPDYMGGPLYLGPYFNILPIIAVVLMVIQQQLMTPPPTDEQQEQQQKMMKYMSIFFGFLFYKVAAGLCIYFISTNLWGLAERKLLPRKQTAAVPAAAAAETSPNGPARRGPRGGRREPRKPEAPPGKFQKIKDWWAEVLRQAEKK
jgi:YidC/Oxa1 family membrane protein insertase